MSPFIHKSILQQTASPATAHPASPYSHTLDATTPSQRHLESHAVAGGVWLRVRRPGVVGLILLLCVASLLLTACGSRKNNDADDLETRTAEIARGFAANRDIASARAALDGLGVANGLQWLIYSTESAISSNSDPELTRAYVTLALEMDVREATIRDWAEANGLVEPSAATAVTSGATLAAAVLEPIPTVATLAPAPVDATAVSVTNTTASDTTTSTSPIVDATVAPPAAAAASLTVADLVNLREGPGTEYNLAGSLSANESAAIVAKDASGQWWQIRTTSGGLAWLYAPLATTGGDTSAVAIASDIPTPPPATATPVAVAEAPAVEAAPVEATAAPAEPEAEAPAPAGNPSDTPHFTLVQKRMWTKEENGACAGQHLLRITVLDANGAPLNGIALQGIYTGQVLVTGDQGKGDGRIEYDLYGTGEGFRVIRNNDGRDATSDNAEGFTTKSLDIPVPTLIEGGYCSDEADCQIFYNSFGCTGHHSWEATFQRNF